MVPIESIKLCREYRVSHEYTSSIEKMHVSTKKTKTWDLVIVSALKLPFPSQLLNFLTKYFKELAYIYIYILINAFNEGYVLGFEEKTHTMV